MRPRQHDRGRPGLPQRLVRRDGRARYEDRATLTLTLTLTPRQKKKPARIKRAGLILIDSLRTCLVAEQPVVRHGEDLEVLVIHDAIGVQIRRATAGQSTRGGGH